MISLIEIYKIYFKIGIQLIGGGYVILPLLKKYLVEDKKLMTEDELVDYLALSQCLPGIIALNISIFSGFNLRKIKGAITACLGLITPSFVIILLIAGFIKNFADNAIIQQAFYGIRLSIIVLIFYMIYDIFKNSIKSLFSIILFLFILMAALFTPLTPVMLVTISVLAAIIFNRLRSAK